MKLPIQKSIFINEMESKIFEFFLNNPYPSEQKIIDWAGENHIESSYLKQSIFNLLSTFICEGKSRNFEGGYNEEQLKMGIEVEYEHTTCKFIAEKIAKDHLAEIEDYYTRLANMEQQAKNEGMKD